jgi:uncharacterized protein (TIGR03083 family)
MTNGPDLDDYRRALSASVNQLRELASGLDDAQLMAPAYPTEWSVADVLSHLGSGAVILRRRIDDACAGRTTPDDFGPTVWDEWNAKSVRAKVNDALVADRELIVRLDALTDDERENLTVSMGPMSFDISEFVGLRLNEHVMHTWDVMVAIDPSAKLSADAAGLVADNLQLIARFTARPTGATRQVTVQTTDPPRRFAIDLTPEAVTLATTAGGTIPDLTMATEAFARLVYGRLDAGHTPLVDGDPNVLDELRRVYPGP